MTSLRPETRTSDRGLFFTSIPKAGKNLVYSFLAELGVQRATIERERAVWAAESGHLAAAGREFTYALGAPAMGLRPMLPLALEQFSEAAAVMAPGVVIHHHFPFEPSLYTCLAQAGVPIIFVYRDPRDTLLSMADYILVQRKPGHLVAHFAAAERDELVERLWTGDDRLLGFGLYFQAFWSWAQSPGVTAFRFEDLVGESGKGSGIAQTEALRQLAALVPPVSESIFRDAQARTFNRKAGTFYKGVAGRWREETGPRIKNVLFSGGMRDLVLLFGFSLD